MAKEMFAVLTIYRCTRWYTDKPIPNFISEIPLVYQTGPIFKCINGRIYQLVLIIFYISHSKYIYILIVYKYFKAINTLNLLLFVLMAYQLYRPVYIQLPTRDRRQQSKQNSERFSRSTQKLSR